MTRRQSKYLKEKFLEVFRKCGNVSAAAEKAGIQRINHYKWLERDSKYAQAFRDAEQEAVDALELEARRRAQVGWDEPVYQAGRQVGTVRKYDSRLLMFLLKSLRPEKYRESDAPKREGGRTLEEILEESHRSE